jgi:hypothetical protein
MKALQSVPVAILTFLLSVGFSLALYLLDITDTGQSVICALLFEIFFVVHRSLYRLERADPLRGLADGPQIDTALNEARAIYASRNPKARILLDQTVSTFVDRVHKLGTDGITLSPEEFMDFSEDLFASAKEGDQLRATSLMAGGKYWERRYGARYEQINRQAADRGLFIERLYFLRDLAHLDEVRPILDRQSAFSKIRVALLDDVPEQLSAPNSDFYVFNSQVTAEFIFVPPDMTLKHIEVCTRREEVERKAVIYQQIRERFTQPHVVPAAKGTP